MLSLLASQLSALFVGTFFYGVNAISFAFCLHSLLTTSSGQWKRYNEIAWIMLVVGCTLFTFATIDLLIAFTRNLAAFVFSNGHMEAIAVFSDLGHWTTLTKTTLVLLQTIIGDGVLIYRCWIVYGRSWKIIALSMLLWIGSTVSMILVVQIQATLHLNATITATKLEPPNRTFWALSIAQNVLVTTLIVLRIWKVDREASSYSSGASARSPRSSELKRVMRRIIESGLLYTLAVTATFITYVCRSNAIYITSIAEMQIVCIAFNLIIIRASKSRSDEYAISPNVTMSPNHTTATFIGFNVVASQAAPVAPISHSSSKPNELEMHVYPISESTVTKS